jgi:hypothetical protein
MVSTTLSHLSLLSLLLFRSVLPILLVLWFCLFLDSHLQIFSSYTSVRSFVPAFNEQETTEQEEGDEQEEKTTRSWFISDLVFLFFPFCDSAFSWFVEVNVSETTEKDEQE